jgi:hydroxymethylpyrimidine/phosphomethylpyrimidine kinase
VTPPGAPTPPVALTVAGSDPSGGAGIQADLRALAALGVHGISVIAALTVQDTSAVHRVVPVDAGVVADQLRAVTADLPPVASKVGLLATAPNVEVVAEAAATGWVGALVVDPVLRASSGAALTDEGLVDRYRRLLLPACTVVTPNLAEAQWLTGHPVCGLPDMRAAARALLDMGAAAAVVTGGHLESTPDVIDVLAYGSSVHDLRHPRVSTPNTHGTGCTFSAAVAGYLARGAGPEEAVIQAGRFTQRALAGAAGWRLGSGAGPLDQLGAASET